MSKLASGMPGDGITAWTKAIVVASSGDRASAINSLIPAVFANPLTAAVLLHPGTEPWLWFRRERKQADSDEHEEAD